MDPSVETDTSTAGEEDSKEKATEDKFTEKAPKSATAEIKFVRIHGIEPKLAIPFSWVVNNLMNPEYYLHISVCVRVSQANTS